MGPFQVNMLDLTTKETENLQHFYNKELYQR